MPDLLTPLRHAALALPLLLAVAPAPAGTQVRGCAPLVASADPELHASFARFDRAQSAAAAKICALFLNSADSAVPL